MKKFTLTLLILSVIFVFPVFSQILQNTYDLGGDDYANMSSVNASDEIFTVGSSNFLGAGGYDVLLMKVDTSGNFVWHKQYGGSATEFGTAIVQVSDGFAIAGRSNSFTTGNMDILLAKVDNNGDLQWAKTYGTDSLEFAIHFAGTSDGGFIITGQTNSFGNGGTEAFLLKTDSLGNVDWFNTYGSNSDELGFYVVEDPSGGYLLGGSSRGPGGAGLNDMYVVKTGVNGVIEAQFLIGGTGEDALRKILLGNNGALIAGNVRTTLGSPDDIFIGELNTQNFTFNWANAYGGNNSESLANLTALPGGGEYVATGLTQSFGTGNDGLLFTLDSSGNVGFAISLDGGTDDVFQDILITNRGGLVTGYSNSFGGNANDIFINRVGDDPLCSSTVVTLTVTPQVPTIAGPVLLNHSATTGNISANPVTLTQTTTIATVFDICSGTTFLSAKAGNDKTICNGETVQIGGNPSATGGVPPYTYAWSPSSGLDNTGSANPLASPSATTVYTLTLADSSGTIVTDQMTVTVNALNVTVSNDTTICLGSSVQLIATGAVDYSWSPADGLTASEISNPIANPTDTIVYVVIGTTSGCSDSASVTVNVEVCDGIRALSTTQLSVFPNPASDNLNLQISSQHQTPATFSLITIDGKLVIETDLILSFGENLISLQTDNLPSGLYYARIKSADSIEIAKVILE